VVNTRFGELYAERGEAPTWDKVMSLVSDYRSREVPEGVLFLTCGIDVQKDRMVYVVRGWGYSMSAWLIEFGELWGETDQPDVWTRLADFLRTDYQGKQIRLTMIDRGYRRDMVDQFCRTFPSASPARGYDSLERAAPVQASMQDVNAAGKVIKKGIQVWNVDTAYFKDMVHSRIDWPPDQPGAWHLPIDVQPEYAKQIIAESRLPLPSGKVIWKRHDKDNHALDAEVYCAAAARRLGVDRIRAPKPVEPDLPAPPQQAAPVARRYVMRGRFR
jgi:phage terminase large subunit GpA-like protein